MEKNTILAVALSTVVLVIFYVLQGVFFPSPPPAPVVVEHQPPPTPGIMTEAPAPEVPPMQLHMTPFETSVVQAPAISTEPSFLPEVGQPVLQYITVDTERLHVVLTNAGGNVVSWRLNNHRDKQYNVDMIFSGINQAQAFSIAFGGQDAQPITSLFHVNRISEHTIIFYRDFIVPPAPGSDTEGMFRLTKRYDFKPSGYMFELTISLDGGRSVPGFNFSGNAYTLSFGPQIGPRFERLDNRNDFRENIIFLNGRRRKVKANEIIESRPTWAAIAGKYFTIVAIPYIAQYNFVFSDRAEPGLDTASRLSIVRPAANASRIEDTYRFYLGPKSQEALAVYNTGRNEFGIRDMQLVEIASSRGILAPLERILKWMLITLHKVVPNYGIAIILLTLIIKIVFFPLTKKGSEATLRMQALAPRIKEIQDKYKGNSQKLQAEMGNFYKQEGYNPLSGCLPMLLQLPIFIAMYSLFNNHFDLRGAEFIPGWIPDLSVPEYIWNFPGNFRLPLLGWSALRLLPFIYVGSQLLYGKVTQMPGQQSNPQMKMMLYVMPIVFFFVLYEVPSGLLIYWIFSNLLTLVQQVMINKYVIKKRALAEQQQQQQPQQPVIAPRPGGSKKRKK
jgi:YidC/Oxa1 family membrane protein insertase